MERIIRMVSALALSAAALTAAAGEPVRLDYGVTTLTLDNGMDVVVIENHGLPLVSIEIAVKNGSYTESPEFSGLSHLYEHMFFKANTAIPTQERYMERLRELGASWNGTTGEERVNYFMTVHRKNLRDGTTFLRDALLGPLFKEEELKREWPVVLGEFDRNEADPGFHLYRESERLLWGDLFNRKNPIGERSVIFNATSAQMREIQRRYYIPNNSALFVAGDVSPDEVFALAKELFGAWPRSHDPFKEWPIPDFKPLEKSHRIAVTGPVRTIQVMSAWHGPSVGKDDAATHAADVFSYILGQPDSKFQKALVDSGLMDGVGLSYSTLAHVGPIMLMAATSADRLDAAWEAVEAQLAMMGEADYFTDEQIESAKRMIEINEIFSREKPSEFCRSLTYWWAVRGLDYYMGYLEGLRKITREDLQSFVKTYLAGRPRVESVLGSKEDLAKTKFAASAKLIEPESGSSAVAFDKKPAEAAPTAEVSTEEFDVDGLRVVLRRNPATETLAATMVLYGGLQYHGAENAGRELLLLETMDKGSAGFTKEEVNRQLARTGASLSCDSRQDYSMFRLTTLARDLDANFPIFADAFSRPLLSPEEVKLGVERRLTAIKSMEESPDAFIAVLASRNFYKGHPYSVPPSGTEAAIAGLTAEELSKLHESTTLRSRCKLFLAGPVDRAKAEALVRAGFKDLPTGAYAKKPVMREAGQAPRLLVEKRELPTNYVFGCFEAPGLAHPDYPALMVALSILDDRLFEEVRTKRNLSYAVSAQISSRVSNYGALYVTSVKANEAVKVMLDVIDAFAKNPVPEKDLRDKIEEMITHDLMRKQTNLSQSDSLILHDANGAGWAAEAGMIDKIRAVTPEEAQKAVEHYVKGISFAVLGDPAAVDEKLFTSK